MPNANVSCLLVDIVNVLIANGAGLSVVHDHVFLSRAKIGAVLHVEFRDLQRVLLTLNVNGSIHCVGVLGGDGD